MMSPVLALPGIDQQREAIVALHLGHLGTGPVHHRGATGPRRHGGCHDAAADDEKPSPLLPPTPSIHPPVAFLSALEREPHAVVAAAGPPGSRPLCSFHRSAVDFQASSTVSRVEDMLTTECADLGEEFWLPKDFLGQPPPPALPPLTIVVRLAPVPLPPPRER
jgi:hypothetical protein